MPALLRDRATAQPEINVTPFIDVLLALLVIFILINLLLIRPVQDVQLPQPAWEAGGEAGTQIVLELRADGSFAVNQQPVPRGRLAAYLQSTYAHRPSKLLFIRPDTSRSYDEVVAAMDLARGAGVQGIALVPTGAR